MDFRWYKVKEPIAQALGGNRDALHVVFGLVVFGVVCVAWRGRRRLLVAWLAVLALESLNEIADAIDWIRWTGTVNVADTANDIAYTMAIPTLLLAIGWWRGLRRKSKLENME